MGVGCGVCWRNEGRWGGREGNACASKKTTGGTEEGKEGVEMRGRNGRRGHYVGDASGGGGGAIHKRRGWGSRRRREGCHHHHHHHSRGGGRRNEGFERCCRLVPRPPPAQWTNGHHPKALLLKHKNGSPLLLAPPVDTLPQLREEMPLPLPSPTAAVLFATPSPTTRPWVRRGRPRKPL